MTATTQPSLPPLTLEQVRIRIPDTYRSPRRRPAQLPDALDFWMFSGAAANVAMQFAHPGVAAGVMESTVESGALMVHPWKRLRTTASYLAVAILGTPQERAEFREAVDVAHRQVRSGPDSKVKYNAFDRNLQLYVAAAIYIGFEDSHQLLHGKMSPQEREAFYQGADTFGTTLQVHPDMWPQTVADFDEYWLAACRQVVCDDDFRAYIDDLLHLRMINWPMRLLFGGLLQFLTAGFLPPHFREQMGVEWSAADQRRFEHLFLFVGFVNRFIPKFIRFAGTKAMMRDVQRRMRKQKALI
ncbi:oxygenase MpaB family protein [Nocardia wallacei]|uniref:oxygenase MpaB family protein n=1 Tax=Nocardia wallacei TaxID=480035 RepID=UPI002456339D|nr:oxygenase MpaB family protein [Nocardia wallacei]